MYTLNEFPPHHVTVTMHADNVASGWIRDHGEDGPIPHDIDHLWVWHVCDGSLLPNRDRLIPGYYPRWVPTGVRAHTLVQDDPLTLTASLFWPLCCGLHGFITNGLWTPC